MQCRVCGWEGKATSFEVYGGVYRYFQCGGCECLQIERPVEARYDENYRGFSWKPVQHPVKAPLHRMRNRFLLTGKGLIGRVLARFYRDVALESLSSLDLQPEQRILDIGCGTGSVLHDLRDLGFKHVLGVDPYLPAAIEYNNGLQILKSGIEDIEGQWDVVMLHHVFEHLEKPLDMLQAIEARLAAGGVCVIRTPIVPCFAWEHYGSEWVQLDAPRHVFIHSLKSLGSLAREAGLTIERVEYDSTGFQFWGSERRKFSRYALCQFERWAKVLNRKRRGDQVVVTLRRAI